MSLAKKTLSPEVETRVRQVLDQTVSGILKLR